MSFVNAMTTTVWRFYNGTEWVDSPQGRTTLQNKANYADAVSKGYAIAKFYYLKDTDILVGHECIMTEGIRSLPSDFLLKDMGRLVVVGDRNYSNDYTPPKSSDKTIGGVAATPATPFPSEYNPIL